MAITTMVAQAKGSPPGTVMTDADVLGSTGTSCNQNVRGGDHWMIRKLHIGILWYNTTPLTRACLGQGETHDILTYTNQVVHTLSTDARAR